MQRHLAEMDRQLTENCVSMAGNWILGSVMSKVDEEWKKMMAGEDKHTINKDECLNSLVQKLDVDLTALKERRGASAASTAGASSGSGENAGLHSGGET